MISKTREAEVWRRVMECSAEAPVPSKPHAKCKPEHHHESGKDSCLTPAQVMELLEQELMDACTYQTLAMRVKKDLRKILLQLVQEERRHYRKLEAVYYLMTGTRPCPDRPKAPCVACTNEALRARYHEEVEGAARLHKLAECAGSFAPVFHCLGCEEERHAQMILCLLQRCL